MILLISLLFSYTFSVPLPFLSCYRILYNLYLNPNLLKFLLNYTYTISKVTTLHAYIFTSCLIFFTHFHFSYFSFISIFLHIFYLFLLLFLFSFIHFYLLYFSFIHFYSTFLLFLHIVLLCLN